MPKPTKKKPAKIKTTKRIVRAAPGKGIISKAAIKKAVATKTRPFAGRPLTYETPEDLQAAIDKYRAIKDIKPTISGLCYHLGFESRQSFYDYETREGFSYTIKRARLFIEQEYEEKLSGNNVAGPIFALKNLGWKDKQEHGFTDKDGEDLKWQVEVVEAKVKDG